MKMSDVKQLAVAAVLLRAAHLRPSLKKNNSWITNCSLCVPEASGLFFFLPGVQVLQKRRSKITNPDAIRKREGNL